MIISDFLAEDAMVSALARLRASQRQLHLFQLDGAPDWPRPMVAPAAGRRGKRCSETVRRYGGRPD